MAKLHQLLAVESDLEGKYKRISEESKKTFGKGAMFMGFHRKLESFASDAPPFPEENQEMATTVNERLAYNEDTITKYLNALLQKEATNQTAKADLVINGIVIATDVPATFLLGLESRLRYIRGIYEAIPTLQAGVSWRRAEDRGNDIWESVHPEEKLKTEMQYKSQILVPPTEHHRAEIEKWQEQVPVGKFVRTTWCGMITTADKAKMLENIDNLIRATKMARQKANSVEVVKVSIGKDIMKFINTI